MTPSNSPEGLSDENRALVDREFPHDVLAAWDRLRVAIDRVVCALPAQMTDAARALEAEKLAFHAAICSYGKDRP